MKQVEFRFLQLLVSHVSGDRVTLGMIHWDGEKLRMSSSFSHLSFCDAVRRDVVKRTVTAKLRRAERQGREAAKRGEKGQSLFGLEDLVRVREGLGSSLYWSPVQKSRTHDAEAHFESLKAQTRLRPEYQAEPPPITNKLLTNQLLLEGDWLRTQSPERVRLSNKVHRLQTFTAPISWKNGNWHHTLPFSLDGLDEGQMAKRVRELIGTVDLCIPTDDVPVPIVVFPQSAALAEVAKREAEIAKECLERRGGCVLIAQRSEGELSLSPVLERIRSDLEQSSGETM